MSDANATPDREPPPARCNRRGVVAVILRQGQFLAIRRSPYVTAPNLICFPGGGIEAGESETDALVREMREELGVEATPGRRLWTSVTPWGTPLAWWLTMMPQNVSLCIDPQEVSETFWFTAEELDARSDLLASVPQFLEAWRRGDFQL
jgi:8-oxo-dGTP diphosphatase